MGKLFNRNLLTLVSANDMRKLLVSHSGKNTLICHYRYTMTILAIKMNLHRLVVCVEDGIFIHNIMDMQLMNKLENLAINRKGIIALSHDKTCFLAYPGSNRTGTVFLFDALALKHSNSINAHDGVLAAMEFNSTGDMLATASVRGTVVRIFAIPSGDKVMEFRRGLTSSDDQFLVAASTVETLHVFKLDHATTSAASPTTSDSPRLSSSDSPRRRNVSTSSSTSAGLDEVSAGGDSDHHPSSSSSFMNWVGSTLKAYLPGQVSEVLNQDRSFAYARLPSSTVHLYQQSSSSTTKTTSSDSPTDSLMMDSPSPTSPTSDYSSTAVVSQPLGVFKIAAIVSPSSSSSPTATSHLHSHHHHHQQQQPRLLLVTGLDGLLHVFAFDPVQGGEAVLQRSQRLLPSSGDQIELQQTQLHASSSFSVVGTGEHNSSDRRNSDGRTRPAGVYVASGTTSSRPSSYASVAAASGGDSSGRPPQRPTATSSGQRHR